MLGGFDKHEPLQDSRRFNADIVNIFKEGKSTRFGTPPTRTSSYDFE